MKVETTYQEKPVFAYWFSFGCWSSASGMFFIRERVYKNGWTPIVRLYKRYDSWLGFFKGNDCGRHAETP